MAWLSGGVPNAMERIRARLKVLLDEKQPGGGRPRQKALAEFVADERGEKEPRSEAWISNILNKRRDLRLVDLDAVALFFRMPPAELLRRPGDAAMELTPTEQLLIRNLRRMDPAMRDSYLNVMGVRVGMPGQKPPTKSR